MAAARGAKPRVSKGQVREALDVKRKSKKPIVQTGATARSGYDPLSDRLLRAIGRGTGNAQLERNLRSADENLIGIGEAEQSAFNIGRGEGGGWDAANIALALPMAGLVDKPISLAAKAIGRAGKPLAAKAANSAVGRYLTEARPLVDEAVDTVEGAFSVRPAQLGAPKVRGARPVPPAATERLPLPAPEERLGLPAPGPGLPEFAAKPRGGQWWANQPFAGGNTSPEYAAEALARGIPSPIGAEWMQKALTKYLKNDFGAPTDPLRDLAARGLHFDPEMTPERWHGAVNSALLEDPIQSILFPSNPLGGMRGAGDDLRGEAMAAMPWLGKLPVTDSIYGVSPQRLDLSHFTDEMANALNPEASGIPADLAVRPESLARMSFPQAVERVGRINQWRAKQAEQAQLSALNNPAVQMFKEYPDDPRGLRWVQLRAPDIDKSRIAEIEGRLANPQPGDDIMALMREMRDLSEQGAQVRGPLQEALKYEGDVMGHCVGGYCDDVLQGRSNIYSLRDAKGEPHVTIETGRPYIGNNPEGLRYEVPDDAQDTAYDEAWDALRARGDPALFDADGELTGFGRAELNREQDLAAMRWQQTRAPENIVQIKGKQNLAPKEDYLPYVQDFVKSGKWGEIGDLANTGLVKLPDGRYIRQEDWTTGIRKAVSERNPRWSPARLDEVVRDAYRRPGGRVEEQWAGEYAPYFEGYARGGRVRSLAAKPCSCDKSLAVR